MNRPDDLKPEVSIIVPLFNEEKVFPLLIDRLVAVMQNNPFQIEVVLVDDGSTDETRDMARALALEDQRFKAVFLSRNFGHQIALTAGMSHVAGEKAVMIIDGDLQDPPELIGEFYLKIKDGGYDVVYAIREKRKESIFKRMSYWAYYRVLRMLSDIEIPLDSGDFCMISRKVNDIVISMPERSRFIRGLRTWVGFKQIGVKYERSERGGGEPKYTLAKLRRLAYDGIFNFSYKPLRFVTRMGMYTILISLVYLSYVLFQKIFGYPMPGGFATLVFAISLFSGVQLISIGIIGEYVARIYQEVKNRPMFIVSNVISNGKDENAF